MMCREEEPPWSMNELQLLAPEPLATLMSMAANAGWLLLREQEREQEQEQEQEPPLF